MFAVDSELALKFGMSPRHAGKLREFCQGAYRRKRLLMIIRSTNKAGLQWHDRAHVQPKSVHVKDKTDKQRGLVTVEAQTYFPDYDMHGVYELRDTAPPTYYRLYTGNYVNIEEKTHWNRLEGREPSLAGVDRKPLGSAEFSPFVKALNAFVCGDGPLMFQHGAQDGFLVAGRPILDAGARFLVFEPTGHMSAVYGRERMKAYYHSKSISWAYRD